LSTVDLGIKEGTTGFDELLIGLLKAAELQ
jgi:hypothetical protein